MTRYDARVHAIVDAVEAANPLPSTIGQLSGGARKALEIRARADGLTSEAALAIARANRTRTAELDSIVDSALAAVRAARG